MTEASFKHGMMLFLWNFLQVSLLAHSSIGSRNLLLRISHSIWRLLRSWDGRQKEGSLDSD